MGNNFKRFLAFVLAFAMIFAYVPANAFATENETAMVPETNVIDTEAELAEALAAGGEVKLGDDINVAAQIEIPEGKTVVLDLAGYDIIGGLNGTSTTKHIYVLSNKGTLTVNDSVGNGKIVSRGVYNYGSLTLNGGTIDACDGDGGYAVNNESGSTFVMNGGTVTASYEDDHQNSSGGYDATALDVPAGCTATLNGGTVTSVTDFTFAISAAGTLNVPANSTVVVQGYHGAIAVQGGITTINAGTFSIPADEYVRTDNVLYVSGGSLVINGGTFIGDSDVPAGGSCVSDVAGGAVINGGTFGGSSGGDVCGTTGTTINGGTFENLIETQHVAKGATIVNGGKTYTKTENGEMEEVVVVAKIGNQGYETIAAAIAAAKDGDTVVIMPGEYGAINISNKNITIAGTVGDNGELLTTIKDGNPAITGHGFNGTIKNLKIDAWKAMYAEPAGNVTVDNVYVTGATYGFHLIAYAQGLTWTIQNSYMDLRWANSFGVYGEGDAAIIVKGNQFESTDPYYPDYGALAVNTFLPNVTVEENIFGENAKIMIREAVTDTSKINISKNYHADGVENAFVDDSAVKVNIDVYYNSVGADGKLTDLVDTRVAKIGDEYFATLAEAIEAAKAMESATVTVLNDVVLDAPLVITGDVTLDLNGKTISQEKACTASYEMISNNGKLTITGNGKISFKDTGAGDPNFGWGSYTIRNAGTLIVENGTIEHLGEQNPGNGQPNVHMYCAIFQYSGSTTINGGTISTPTYRSARLWSGDMTVNGGNFDGQLWVQCVNDTSKLTINGGSFAPNGNDGSSVFVSNASKKAELSVTGGTFEAKIGASEPAGLTGDLVKGGTFTADAATGTDNALLAEGYEFKQNSDGTYGAEANPAYGKVAEVNGEYYETLAAAIAAAEAGDTITFVADITEDVTIDKNLTIDGAGFKYTGKMAISNDKVATIISVNFVKGYIEKAEGTYGTLTIQNCTFDGIDKSIGYAIKMQGGDKLVIENSSAKYYKTGMLYVPKSVGSISVNNVTAENVSAAFNISYSGDALFENVTLNNVTYGIHFQIYSSRTYTVKNCDLKGATNPFWFWDKSNNAYVVTVVFEGDNDLGTKSISVKAGALKMAAGATLTAAEGLTITTDVENGTVVYADGVYSVLVDPTYGKVAQIGTEYYATLQAAINAAENEDVIVLVNDITLTEEDITLLGGKYNTMVCVADKTVTIDLNGKTVSMEYTNDALLVGMISVDKNGHLTLKDSVGGGKIESNSTGKVYCLIANYDTSATTVIESGIYKANQVSNSLVFSDGSGVTVNGGDFYLGNAGTVNEGGHKNPWIFNCNDQGTNSVRVNGGTYNQSPLDVAWGEAHVPYTKAVVQNADNKYEVVDAVAYIATNDHGYATINEALADAQAGETVTLLADMSLSDILVINKAITLDGNGKTLTSTAARAINVSGADGATIKNLTINASGERAINIIEKATNVTIDNVTATAANYTVNVAASAPNAVVAIENSTLNGLNVVNVAAAGAKVTVDNSTVNCNDNNTTAGESYAALCLNKAAVGGSIIATNTTVNVTAGSDSEKGRNGAENGTVTINGSTDGVSVTVAVITYPGSDYYYGFTSIADAIEFAKAGDTITLIRDVKLSQILTINKAITLDGNGKTLTSTAGRAINVSGADADGVTIKNLTIKASGERAINIIQNATNVTIENVTATAANYTVNIAGSAPNAVVAIENSTLNGLCTVNVSAVGAKVTVDNSTVNCNDNNTTAGESYAALSLNKEAVGGSIVATNTTVNVAEGSDSYKGRNGAENGTVTINGSTEDVLFIVAVITYAGQDSYHGFASLAAAIEFAKAGDTITLIRDVTASEVILIDKSLTINGNGHKVTSNATRVFRVTASNVDVTLNNVDMVSKTVMTYPNDIRGISIDAQLKNVKLTLNNCSVDFTDASACDWAYAVNVSGNGTGHTVTVNGGTYEGANVINVHGANNTVIVKDATLNCLYPNNDMYAGACIWVLQNQNSSVKATGNTFNGGNAIAFNLGTGTALTESDNTDNTKIVVAKIDGSYYHSLAEAFEAAQDGDTIKVLHNIDLAEGITNTKKVTLDLNGKTITGTDNATGSFGLITNKGDLTVTGNGTITLTANNNRGWNAYSSIFSNTVGGKLTIENGTFEHKGGTDMAYAIDNLTNGKGTYAETVINGGTIKSTYRAVRQFLNGVEAQNILTVNGGTIEGTNKSIWMQDPSKNANSGTLTVTADATLKGDVYLFVTAGSTEWPVEVSIAAAALADGSDVITGNVPATYVVENNNGTWGVSRGLKGEGTEANPYQISTLSELILFRDSVNAGETKYNAPGVWVALTADIDLAGTEAWTVGIGDGHNYSFDGCFDGKGHTIKNLTVNPYADSENPETAYICGGLFGYIYGPVVIRNLTIENASIATDAAGHNVGVLVGFANNKGGKAQISDITIKNATVNTPNANGVGAIVGYSYRDMGTIENCSVDGATITGASFVGGITGYSYAGAVINGCTVNDATITATSKGAGGIAGLVMDNTITNNTVSNTTVTAPTNWGYVVGEIGSDDGVLVENNNAAEPQVGGNYSTGEPVQAKIGDVYYTTFAAAYAAAEAGETITLLTPVVVKAGETLTLNKGVTITYTSDVMGEAMITNNGTLVVGGDTIAYIYSGNPDSSYGKGNYTVANRGDMTVNSGKITVAAEGVTGKFSHALYAIDNYSGSELTINGGEVSNGNNIAIRTFGAADVNVTGGKIEGVRAIWIQLPGSNAAEAPAVNLNVNGGELNSNDATYNLAVYVTTNGQSAKNVKIDIADGIFNGDVALNTAATGTMVTDSVKVSGGIFNGEYGVFTYADADEKNIIGITGGTFATLYSEQYALDNGYGFKADSGVYMVAPVADAGYVAELNGVYYKKLNDAVKAAVAGDVIDLIADAGEDNYALVGKNLTINKNGHTAVAIAALYGYTVLDNDNAYVVVKTSEIVNNAGEALAYIDADLNGYVDEKLMTLQDALDAAQAGQTVRMKDDLTVGTIIIPTDVTLDLESHTLTADRVIGLNGSKLTANAMAKNGTGSGILKVEKNNVLLGEACFMKSTTMGVLPVWNKDHYEFSLFAFEVSTTKQGLRVNESTQNINFVFRHMSSDYYMTHVLNDENADHGIKVVLEISWTTDNGVPYQTFVYNSKFFAEVAEGGMNYTFNLDGYEAMFLNVDTMKIVVKVVTETGALLESRPYTMEDNKLN